MSMGCRCCIVPPDAHQHNWGGGNDEGVFVGSEERCNICGVSQRYAERQFGELSVSPSWQPTVCDRPSFDTMTKTASTAQQYRPAVGGTVPPDHGFVSCGS